AKKMIGLADNDPRPLTLTGGLGFFGGPGNNYSLHSVATLAQMISAGEKSNGLITALGWFMYKHAAGIYSNQPLGGEFKDYDIKDQQGGPVGNPPEKIKEQMNGTGTIETYTVIYSSDGQPSYAVIYGRTKKGCRFISNTQNALDIYQALMSENRIGQRVSVVFDASKNVNVAQLV
ncbi:MAG: OB-fold domain-containing protein, partial [Desulfobacula sp.]|nr:OB-fold domain-containing protein [Desulfobacula sp.]